MKKDDLADSSVLSSILFSQDQKSKIRIKAGAVKIPLSLKISRSNFQDSPKLSQSLRNLYKVKCDRLFEK